MALSAERVLREVSVRGQNGHNGLTDIADLVARQRIERRRVIIFHPRRRAHRLDQIMQILRGVDGEGRRTSASQVSLRSR